MNFKKYVGIILIGGIVILVPIIIYFLVYSTKSELKRQKTLKENQELQENGNEFKQNKDK